jgi:prepilin-type N-terminal cleavage/methylation domain-containing protein
MSTVIRRRPAGFTLIELLVVIAIIAVLAAILFPVLSAAKAKANQSKCMSHIRQITLALTIYAQDHEKYPEARRWNYVLDLPKEIWRCPSRDDLEFGYGLNAFLPDMKAGVVMKPSEVIALCDAPTTTTLTADYKRHGNGAVFARLDSSVVWAKRSEDAGRWGVGKFPIVPKVLYGDDLSVEAPEYFVEHTNDLTDYVTKEFCVVGPYGDGKGDGVKMVAGSPVLADLLNLDYIGEGKFIDANADESPIPGDPAPKPGEMEPPLPTDTPQTAGSPVTTITKWTVPGNPGGVYKMQEVGFYNTKFVNRTTYAVTYIFSPVTQNVAMEWYSDDGGMVWLNGTLLATDNTQDAGTKPSALVSFTMPQGISYMLVRTTDGPEGMKFKMRFMGAGSNQFPSGSDPATYNALTAPLSFSPKL